VSVRDPNVLLESDPAAVGRSAAQHLWLLAPRLQQHCCSGTGGPRAANLTAGQPPGGSIATQCSALTSACCPAGSANESVACC
jgi:hypothetical protein